MRYSTPRVVGDPAQFAAAFTEELNGVRTQAGLPPVSLEGPQSATATRVAPHYFAALAGKHEERVADVVALGLLAGWEVEGGDIRSGSFASVAVPETDDLAVLLGSTLEDPVGRFALLDPESSRLAIGSVHETSEETPVLGAVVTSYELFADGTERADAEALLALLTRERRKRELPEPYRLVSVWNAAIDSALEVRHGTSPDDALEALVETSVQTLSQELMSWYGETSELGDFEFPAELLDAPRLGVAIGVSRHKGAGEAWARYVVLVVSVTH